MLLPSFDLYPITIEETFPFYIFIAFILVWQALIPIVDKVDDFDYSVLKLFIGFADAAFTVLDPTATNAMIAAKSPAITKIIGLNLIRNA